METQGPALIGLRIGRIAVDGGTEDQIVARHHDVVQVDAVQSNASGSESPQISKPRRAVRIANADVGSPQAARLETM
jgi:hypothetical protein